jgi:hypothetical protein
MLRADAVSAMIRRPGAEAIPPRLRPERVKAAYPQVNPWSQDRARAPLGEGCAGLPGYG